MAELPTFNRVGVEEGNDLGVRPLSGDPPQLWAARTPRRS